MVAVLRLSSPRFSIGSTYESASTAGFKHGRTETIRSATPQRCVRHHILFVV